MSYNKYYARTHTGGLVSNEELAKRRRRGHHLGGGHGLQLSAYAG